MWFWPLLRVSLFLVVLWAAAQALLYWQKQKTGPGQSSEQLRLVESLSLGQETAVHLIEVEGQRLIIGASRSCVSLLAQGPAPTGSGEDKDGHSEE